MAGMDRFEDAERGAARPARNTNLAWLAEAATWFAVATAGMFIVFAGLAVDAYKHNHNAADETLLSMTNPGHLLAAIGLALTSISVLVGLSIAMLKDTRSAEHAIRRFLPLSAAMAALVAMVVGSLTYMGATGATNGQTNGTTAVAAAGHDHGATTVAAADDAGGVASGLQANGIDPSTGGAPGSSNDTVAQQAAQVSGALTQGSNGAAGHAHDHGKQPTFAQLESMSQAQVMPLFPADTVSEADFPVFKQQVEAVHQVALQFASPEDAKKAGYVITTSDVPFMGEHYLNYDLVKKGIFDPSRPQGLLYSKIGPGGAEQLVGVWFLLVPGINGVTRDTEPQGFAGNLDLWHAHTGLCLVGLSGASEKETKESCSAKSGTFVADLRWMMHVWVAPTQENPDGVFAYLNGDLFQKQQAAAKTAAAPSGLTQ